ncbi:hypothetical protein RDABS01_035062, partial [Bienertia sinuspersici]
GAKRGPSRGLKSRRWREKHPNEKPYAKISNAMLRVVGTKVAQFISDCSRWVKEYCPLNARRNRPDGIDITKWEWLVDVFWSDPKQQRISDKNKRNKLKQTVLHSNGAKSTARILEELMNTPHGEVQQLQQTEGLDGTSLEADSEQQGDPLYVKLYEKTHRHATTGLMELDAEANLKALRELHKKQLQEHGVEKPHTTRSLSYGFEGM